MTTFRDIIPIEDDYEVQQTRATIAVKTVQWCHELWYFLYKVKHG
jgi:hypothetical protein